MAVADSQRLVGWLEERLRDERQLLQHRHLLLTDSLRLELGEPAPAFASSAPQGFGSISATLQPTDIKLAICDQPDAADLKWSRWQRATAHAASSATSAGSASARPPHPRQLALQGLEQERQDRPQSAQIPEKVPSEVAKGMTPVTPQAAHESRTPRRESRMLRSGEDTLPSALQHPPRLDTPQSDHQDPTHSMGVPMTKMNSTASVVARLAYSLGHPADEDMPVWDSEWSDLRKALCRVIHSKRFEATLAIVIIVNILFAALEMDMRGISAEEMQMFSVSARLFLVIYTIELSLRLWVYGRQFIYYRWNNFDLFVVSISFAGEFLGGFAEKFEIFRVLRTLRLVRIFRAMSSYRELYLIINGFQSTLKTIGWACFMLGVIVLILAMFTVDIFQPIVDSLLAENEFAFGECRRCPVMFSTVFEASLTWFVILIVGGGWEVAFPIIAQSPWTVIVFCGSVCLVGMGFNNLILAVIVENAVDARENDEKYKIMQRKTEESKQKQRFLVMCKRLDSDGSGELTMSELTENIQKDKQFKMSLEQCGVEEDALRCVFDIMDIDRSGTVSYGEFVDALFRIKNGEISTQIAFLKHHLVGFRNDFVREISLLHKVFASLGSDSGDV